MTSPKFIHGSLLLMLALALAQKGMTQSARKGEGSQTNETNRPALSVQSTNPFPTNKSIATVEPLASTNAASIAVCYASATNPAAEAINTTNTALIPVPVSKPGWYKRFEAMNHE